MLFWIFFTALIIVIMFALVVFFGPPYVPTLRRQADVALELLDMKPGETLLELGSGDGRVVLAAAKRGYNVVGIELNPLLFIISLIVTRKYRPQVRLIWGTYWGKPWPRADAIFTFMLPRYMGKLDQRIELWHPKPIKLASFAFAVPDREPIATKEGVYLYQYK